MTVTISHRDWLKQTDGGFTSIRSSELKSIDGALAKYHLARTPETLVALQGALVRWMQKEGNGWKSSPRNRGNIVENLYRQVTDLGPSRKELVALSFIRDESRAIVTDLFQGRQLVFRKGIITKLAGNGTLGKLGAKVTIAGVVRSSDKLSGGAVSGAIRGAPGQLRAAVGAGPVGGGMMPSAPQFAQELLAEIVPRDVYEPVMSELASIMPTFLAELTASMTPFVGLVTTGGGVVVKAVKASMQQYAISNSHMHMQRTFSADEPEAAFRAVILLLERERNASLEGLGVGLSEFGGKLASMLADGGVVTTTAVGLAAGVVRLVLLVRMVVRDVQERNAANKLLLMPTVNAKLFSTCPIMGAYLVLCAPTSVVVNTLLSSEHFFQPGMMDKVEHAATRHVEPLKARARTLVAEHRMWIPELQHFPGMLERSKKKLAAMEKAKGKGSIAGQFDAHDGKSADGTWQSVPTRARR